jgi:hypothetical protein
MISKASPNKPTGEYEQSQTIRKGGAPESPAMGRVEPDLGDAGGKYRLIVELGQGGTAVVYLAVARGQLRRVRNAVCHRPDLHRRRVRLSSRAE